MKNLKDENVDNVEILNIVIEIEEEDRTIKHLKEDYPNKIEKLEEVLLNYIRENDPKLLKTEFPDKRNYFTKKIAKQVEFFICIDDY